MSRGIVTRENLEDIADAIRAKLDTDDTYTPAQMAAAIGLIHGEPVLQSKTATQNGTVTPDSGYDGFDQVTVNVPNTYGASDEGKVVQNAELVAQTSRSVTANGTYDTTANDEVVVNVSGGEPVIQPLTATENGTYTPPTGVDGYGPVTVNVSGGGGDDPFALTDYIESSGTQYIDTGYLIQSNTVVEAVVNLSSQTGSPVYFGTRTGASSGQFRYSKSSANNTIQDGYGSSAANVVGIAAFTNSKSRIQKSCVGSKIDKQNPYPCGGLEYSNSYVSNSYPLVIFAINTAGTIGSYANMKLYRFRIFEGETLVHEFVPWTDSNDVVCLKDTVTGNLKYNAGTGVFTRGTDT